MNQETKYIKSSQRIIYDPLTLIRKCLTTVDNYNNNEETTLYHKPLSQLFGGRIKKKSNLVRTTRFSMFTCNCEIKHVLLLSNHSFIDNQYILCTSTKVKHHPFIFPLVAFFAY